jgi:hypothetical protein
VTVPEWLNGKAKYRGKVAALGSWDVFPFIFSVERAGFLVNAGYDPLTVPPVTPAIALLNKVKAVRRSGTARYTIRSRSTPRSST